MRYYALVETDTPVMITIYSHICSKCASVIKYSLVLATSERPSKISRREFASLEDMKAVVEMEVKAVEDHKDCHVKFYDLIKQPDMMPVRFQSKALCSKCQIKTRVFTPKFYVYTLVDKFIASDDEDCRLYITTFERNKCPICEVSTSFIIFRDPMNLCNVLHSVIESELADIPLSVVREGIEIKISLKDIRKYVLPSPAMAVNLPCCGCVARASDEFIRTAVAVGKSPEEQQQLEVFAKTILPQHQSVIAYAFLDSNKQSRSDCADFIIAHQEILRNKIELHDWMSERVFGNLFFETVEHILVESQKSVEFAPKITGALIADKPQAMRACANRNLLREYVLSLNEA